MRKIFLSKTTVCFSLVLLLTGAALALSSLWDQLERARIKSVEYRDISFDSHSSEPPKRSVKTFQENVRSEAKEIAISFLMKVYSISDWNNVFQTADYNEGVRMELSQPANIAVVIGADSREGLRAVPLSDRIDLNKEYAMRISISRDNKVSACIDNSCIKVRDDRLAYHIKNIAIGTGFSKTRPFDGQVKDFRIAYTLIKPLFPKNVILFLKFLLFVATALLAFTILQNLSTSLGREEKIDIVALVVMIGFVLAVFYHYFVAPYFGLDYYPFNTFLFRPNDKFMDYFNGLTYAIDGRGAGMVGTPGIAYLMWQFLYFISFKDTYMSFIVYSVITGIYILFYNLGNLLSSSLPRMFPIKFVQRLFIFSFMSYPVLFTLDRGNVEGLTFILLSLFVYFFSTKRMVMSAVFLAAATALKVYPVIFLILYLSEKRYREVAIFVAIMLFLFAWNFESLQGVSFRLSNFYWTIKSSANPETEYNALYVIGDEGAGFCSSAFGGLKALIYAWKPQSSGPVILKLFKTYYWVSLLSFALVALYVVFIEKEFWKKVAILTLSMIFFPFVAGDYKLLHLYIPMWLFFNSKERSRTDSLYAILFALLLIPKAYYFIKGEISISVILNPLMITVFLATTIATGMKDVSPDKIKQSILEHVAAIRRIFRPNRILQAREGDVE